MNRIGKFLAFLLGISLMFFSCEQEEELQAVNINFDNTSLNLNSEIKEGNVNVIFSREVNQAGTVAISLLNNDLEYGKDKDFYTIPEAENNSLMLSYEAGSTAASFTIKAGEGLNIEEDKTINLELTSLEGFQLGQNSILEVAFSENFVAQSGTIEMNAGGPDFTQQAFVDLSKISSLSVDKNTWDLGFYSGEGHHVTLNATVAVMARQLDNKELSSVTPEDTIGFASEMQIGFTASPPASAWIDEPNGDLTKTAISSISATDSENKVYIIKRSGEGRNWKKVKIEQSGEGYIISYANIDATEFETIEISKSFSQNFIHFDLDNGEAEFTPEKEKWDLMYGTYNEKFPFGPNTIPYSFKDYIVINRHNTASAMVITDENNSYQDFNLQQAEALDFSSEINSIGAKWRQGGGPGSSPAVFEDRFFVLRDSQDNYYKVRFISMYNENNERGHTSFEFAILK